MLLYVLTAHSITKIIRDEEYKVFNHHCIQEMKYVRMDLRKIVEFFFHFSVGSGILYSTPNTLGIFLYRVCVYFPPSG